MKIIIYFLSTITTCGVELLTMEALLDYVRKQHPFMQAETLDVDMAESTRRGIKGGESWLFQSNPNYIYQEPVSSSPFTSRETKNLMVDAMLSRPWWKTGGRTVLKWDYDYLDQKPGTFFSSSTNSQIATAFPKYYQHGVFLSYIQPLLKNRGGRQDRLTLDLQEYAIDITRLQTMENKEDFLLQIGELFIEWATLTRQEQIAQDRKKLAEEQLSRTREQRKSNLVDEVDLLRVENGLHVARQRTMLYVSRKRAAHARLAAVSGMPGLYSFEPDYKLTAKIGAPLSVLNVPWKSILEWEKNGFTRPQVRTNATDSKNGALSLSELRVMKILELEQARQERELRSYLDQERPEINLEIGSGVRGGDKQYSESWDMDKTELRVGFSVEYPLGNITPKSEVERARQAVKQVGKRKAELEQNLRGSIYYTLIQFDELSRILELNKEQIQSAIRKTEAESEMYKQGRSSMNFVIESRDGEAEARNNLVENAATYHKLKLELDALLDCLL